VNILHQNDVAPAIAMMSNAAVLADRQDGDTRKITFTHEDLKARLVIRPMFEYGNDADKARLFTIFDRDPHIDLAFVNAFNSGTRASYAHLGEEGILIFNSFILAGLPREQAELVLYNHILEFKRDAQTFNDLAVARIQQSKTK
jgi:hypothetical protein